MAFKPSTKKKASQRDKEGASQNAEWQALRAEVAKDTKQDLSAKVSKYRLPTGISFIDVNMGWTPQLPRKLWPHCNYGLMSGRIVLLHGKEGLRKSSLLYHLGAIVQNMGGYFWLDNPENSWNQEVADIHGVSTDDSCFMGTQSENIEMHLNTLNKFLQSPLIKRGVPILIGLDTLAALSTKKEAGETLDHSGLPMGVPGKLAQWFRSTNELKGLGDYPVFIVIIQQNRSDPGAAGSTFGNLPEKVPGGRALRYWTSHQIEIHQCSKTYAKEEYKMEHLLDKGRDEFCKLFEFEFKKNRTQIGQRCCPVPYWDQWGFDDPIACFDYLVAQGYIAWSGAYLKFNDQSKYRDDWHKAIAQDPKLALHVTEMGKQAYYQENFEDRVTFKAGNR